MKRMFKSATLLFAVIAIAFGLESCGSVKSIDKAKLEGYWVLKSLKGEDAKTAFTGAQPSLEFNFGTNMIAGSGGCNRYSGGFTLTDQNLFSAPKLASTMMACMDANKEPQFFTALSTPNLKVSLDNGLLTFSQDKTVVLQFEKGEAPAKTGVSVVTAEALTGKWILSSIDGGDMASLFGEKIPTMEVAADGKVFGNAGCNNYRTTYKLDGNTVTFGPVAGTKMACPFLTGEGLFTSQLSAPLQTTMNGDKLTFLKAGKVVLEFQKAK